MPELERMVNYAIRRMTAVWQPTAAEIDDLRQDGLIAALTAARRYNPAYGRQFGSWVLDKVFFALRDSMRRLRSGGITGQRNAVLKASLSSVDTGASTDVTADEAPGPEAAAEQAQAMAILRRRLRDADMHTLSLYYGLEDGDEATVDELAAKLGCSRKHAFTLLSRARAAAKKRLGSGSGV